jgi:hypothetical protein
MSIAPLSAQTMFELEADTAYVLKVPSGYESWVLFRDAPGSEWCYYSREKRNDVEKLCFDGGPTYSPNAMATVELVNPSSVKVTLKDGRTGWIARELVDMTTEQRKEYQAQQDARAKRIAQAKALQAKRAADARARESGQQAKERAYIAALPKLYSGSDEVLVATSPDCARDLKNIIEFGRRNGTGIEFRKKILELVTLGCAINIPSGTAITVSHRDREFVTFCAYDGPKKGTCGIALSEHVH